MAFIPVLAMITATAFAFVFEDNHKKVTIPVMSIFFMIVLFGFAAIVRLVF